MKTSGGYTDRREAPNAGGPREAPKNGAKRPLGAQRRNWSEPTFGGSGGRSPPAKRRRLFPDNSLKIVKQSASLVSSMEDTRQILPRTRSHSAAPFPAPSALSVPRLFRKRRGRAVSALVYPPEVLTFSKIIIFIDF